MGRFSVSLLCRQQSHFFLRQLCRICQARQNILALYGGIFAQQIFDAVAAGEHSHNLMNRNARSFNASLAVTDKRVNYDSFVHAIKYTLGRAIVRDGLFL